MRRTLGCAWVCACPEVPRVRFGGEYHTPLLLFAPSLDKQENMGSFCSKRTH